MCIKNSETLDFDNKSKFYRFPQESEDFIGVERSRKKYNSPTINLLTKLSLAIL